MRKKITYISILGFLITLFIMYGTNFGVLGIEKYYSNFKLLDIQLFYNYHTVIIMFNRLGNLGIKAYISYIKVDFVFILFLFLVQYNISYYVSEKNKRLRKILYFLVIFRGLLDVIEDNILLILFNKMKNINLTIIKIISTVTSVKLITIYLWFILIIVNYICSYIKKHKNRVEL